MIDTNIHAAYLLQNFETDEVTRQYLETYESLFLKDRLIPDFILGELETFIMQVVPSRYKLVSTDTRKLRQLASDYMHGLLKNCTVIGSEVGMIQRAGELYFENFGKHYMSLVDCLVLATAEQNKYTLFTKDVRLITSAKLLQIACLEPQNRRGDI